MSKLATDRPCDCGSGLDSSWAYDARGIELCRTCDACHGEKMKKYRPDVLSDRNYWHTEPLDEE
jgi:hypothetical protein